ncbi:MAG: tetratricopeptide repeat protein [Acidobacteriota bacterium]
MSALSFSSTGCVSSSDLDTIGAQLEDIQVQVLQLRKDTPTQDQLVAVEGRLASEIGALQVAQAELRTDVGDLTEQIERLQSKLDDTNFRLVQLSQQIIATNEELQAVRTAAEEARRERPPAPSRPALPDAEDPQALYDAAYADHLAGNYDLAVLGFRRYLDRYPNTELADNATYWLGESYFSQGRYRQALSRFDSVLDDFERSDRDASARLRKGYAHLELGQRDEGLDAFRQVACDHTETEEAKVARDRMSELGASLDCPAPDASR